VVMCMAARKFRNIDEVSLSSIAPLDADGVVY
jgi:hypothetical protein